MPPNVTKHGPPGKPSPTPAPQGAPNGPGKVTLPPPKNKKQQSQQAVFTSYINGHPTMRQYASLIYRAAIDAGIDPVYYASLLWHESFSEAKRLGVPVESIMSPTGAGVGIAQINPGAHPEITRAQMLNPSFAITWGAKYLKQGLVKFGSYAAAYNKFYNRGYKGNIFNDIPKGYVPTGLQRSAEEAAQRAVDTSAAKQALTNPWVVITKKGGVKYVFSEQPPAGVLRFGGKGGTPIDRDSFLQLWRNRLDPIFISYTGKRATPKDAANVIRNGTSDYQLQLNLANRPTFYTSPIYKSLSPGYQGVLRGIYGADAVDKDTEKLWIRNAIIHNLGGDGFGEFLRQQPQYLNSAEFKGASSSLNNVYQAIYGTPDVQGGTLIKEAARQGWNPDMFASYLRSRPEYTSSSEYETKALSILSALGIFTGQVPVLRTGQAPANTAKPEDGPPNSALIPGDPAAALTRNELTPGVR